MNHSFPFRSAVTVKFVMVNFCALNCPLSLFAFKSETMPSRLSRNDLGTWALTKIEPLNLPSAGNTCPPCFSSQRLAFQMSASCKRTEALTVTFSLPLLTKSNCPLLSVPSSRLAQMFIALSSAEGLSVSDRAISKPALASSRMSPLNSNFGILTEP